MKIGIACFPTYGGSGVVASELAMSLAERGHVVHLFSYASPIRLTRFSDRLIFHEVEDFPAPAFPPSSYTLDLAAKIVEVARGEGLDLLNAHYAIPHSIAGILARRILRGRLKVVTTLHGTDITWVGSHPSYAAIVKHALEASDSVTAVSKDLAQQTCALFSVRRPIHVLHNFVDTGRFGPRPRAHRDPFTIVHLSNFRPLKRIPDVIRTFQRVAAAIPGAAARLVLAGDGPERPMAERLTQDLGLAAHVRFLGQQDAVEEILGAGDLLLLPSASETFGLAALEAMACSLPVVATDCGGIREVVAHGKTGFLEPVGDVEALAARCLELSANPAKRRRMGAAGRARVLSAFSLARGSRKYERLYRGLLG